MGKPASPRPSVISLFHTLLDLGSQAQMPVPSNTATHTLLLDHHISDETAESEERAVCDFFFLTISVGETCHRETVFSSASLFRETYEGW